MRTLLPVILACIALASAMGGWMIAAAAVPGGGPARVPAPASLPPTLPQKPMTTASPVDNDAPARHARRTACLKDAKTKKLVGAQRNAYVKGCVGPN
jgi:hypothetical protein